MIRRRAFSIPPVPLMLALAGLLPFFAGAFAIHGFAGDVARQASAKLVLILYAAVILSFLGGVRWGVEMTVRPGSPRPLPLSLSVIGALAGWALAWQGALGGLHPWQFLVLAGLFAAHWLWDLRASTDLPAWYDGLRTIASFGAILALLAGWAAGSPFQS
ncbi:MAG: DUF3429 family protein [Alphaproteobacteria bacterium]|nr:DUF3429 family protein [Alphaproteobacteria bacterium]